MLIFSGNDRYMPNLRCCEGVQLVCMAMTDSKTKNIVVVAAFGVGFFQNVSLHGLASAISC